MVLLQRYKRLQRQTRHRQLIHHQLLRSLHLSLALKSKTNIVAKGTVYGKHGPEEKIHNFPLGKDNVRVCIDMVKCSKALLPVPAGDMETVGDAHKAFVAWPKQFVILTEKEWYGKTDGDKQDATNGNQKAKQGKNDVMNGQPKEVSNSSGSTSKDGEKQLRSFGKLVEEMMCSAKISIPMEKGVYEETMEFCYVSKSDIMDICKLDELEFSSIAAYQRFLYGQYRDSLGKYGFANPANFVGFEAKDDKHKLKHMIARLEARKKNQLILLPFNPGWHWVLIIIDIPSYRILWLDSRGNPHIPNIKYLLNNAVKSSIALKDEKRMASNPQWETVKCPRQKGNTECGVYTMKFMKHFMEDPAQSFDAKITELARIETYFDDELNDIRIELVGFLLDYFPHGL